MPGRLTVPRGLIAYRFQVHLGDGWATEWFETRAEGLDACKRADKQLGTEYHLDECEIPRHKEAFIHALNSADLHRMNWEVGPVREIKKSKR